MIAWSLLLGPGVLLLLVALLSFAGCSLIVGKDRPYGDILLSLHFDVTTVSVKRVAFTIVLDGAYPVANTPILRDDPSNSLIEDRRPDGIFLEFDPYNTRYADPITDPMSGTYGIRITGAHCPTLVPCIVRCDAYPHLDDDEEYFPSAEEYRGNLQPHTTNEFNFELSADPSPLVVAKTAAVPSFFTVVKHPEVVLQFDRSPTTEKVMRVAFRIDGAGPVEMQEQLSDSGTTVPDHNGDTLLAVLGGRTANLVGSNGSGRYALTIRNAPSHVTWSVTCEADDDQKGKFNYEFEGKPIEQPVEANEVLPTYSFKFKLAKTVSGTGFKVVRA